jgi:hypothetical protein
VIAVSAESSAHVQQEDIQPVVQGGIEKHLPDEGKQRPFRDGRRDVS